MLIILSFFIHIFGAIAYPKVCTLIIPNLTEHTPLKSFQQWFRNVSVAPNTIWIYPKKDCINNLIWSNEK